MMRARSVVGLPRIHAKCCGGLLFAVNAGEVCVENGAGRLDKTAFIEITPNGREEKAVHSFGFAGRP